MTMQNASHPLDELLSAYAAGDRDATSDRDLTQHVAGCDRCGPIVADLSLLKAALAQLPDIAPSRPLRLLPPVIEPAGRPAGWWRRLTAPVIAAGAGLVLIGAIGSSGFIGQVFLFQAAGAAPVIQRSSDGKAEIAASGQPSAPELGPTRGSLGEGGALDNNGTPPPASGEIDNSPTPTAKEPIGSQPWSLVLIGGLVLVGGGLAARRATADRDG